MALTNEEYAAKGGNYCPFCGGVELIGSGVEIGTGTAVQEVTCNTCQAMWNDQYKLVGYVTMDEPVPAPLETIEYSVCEDCMLHLANGLNEESTDEHIKALEDGVVRELGGREGHFALDIEPTEDDPEGHGYVEFSGCPCELCQSPLAGSRYGATLVFTGPKAETP